MTFIRRNNLSKDSYEIPSGFNLSNLSSISKNSIVIKNDHDLGGSTIDFGSNKTIYFEGGTLSNGTITGTNCQIVSDKVLIFPSNDVIFSGSWTNDIYPEWWAARNTTNWQPALQSALDFARLSSGRIVLSSYKYQYYDQLTVYEGTSLIGASRGDTAFGSGPTKGTVLHCLGSSLGSTTNNNIAIKVVGRMVTFKDFTIRGERSDTKYGDGIILYGVGDGSSTQSLLEGIYFENILIHGFTKGKGLNLIAGNSGAVTYSNFINIRIRDCADHLKIESLSSNPVYGHTASSGLTYSSPTGFINSNNFIGLYLSGYCETGIHVYTEEDTDLVNSQKVFRPANNLVFNGVIIEPPKSINGHIKIEGGGSSVRMKDIRIEASQQDANYPNVPVVWLGPGTNANVIDCDQMSVPIVDLGWNNRIMGHNSKNGNASQDSENLYKNSSFIGLDKTGDTISLPEWRIQEQFIGTSSYAWRDLSATSSITINYGTSSYVDNDYKVLNIAVPPEYQFRLYQDIDRTLHRLPNAKVNTMLKATNAKDVIWTYQDSVTPIVSGGPCYGGDVWEPIGGFFPITSATLSSYYRIAIFCQNYTLETITFSVTMPSFVTGEKTPLLPAKPITDVGGIFYGPVSYNVVKNILPISNPEHRNATSSDLVLPLEGNYFEINEAGVTIQKINATVNRFSRGAVITLYFNYADITVVNSSYISLTKSYISTVGSTLTLQSPDGNGLWVEVGRTEKKEVGYTLATASSVLSGNYLILDTEYNQFNLTGFTQSTLIQRINYTYRFSEGRQITLSFTDPNSLVEISNSAYISLGITGSYRPTNGDWIKLETIGNGTWYEISRKSKLALPSYRGYNSIDLVNNLSSNYLNLPTTGENYFTIYSGTSSASTVSRINFDSTLRLDAGSELTLIFATSSNNLSTPNINISSSAYISLRYNTSFTPAYGDWIKLVTPGDGTWLEIDRKKPDYKYKTSGYSSIETSSQLSGSYLNLPLGPNYFTLNNTGTSSISITRINNDILYRFDPGVEITLLFGTLTSGISISNSGYVSLSYGLNYTASAGDWIKFITKGDGTWMEVSRKETSTLPPDLSITLSATYLSSNFLTLPLTGENYFKLSAATVGGLITRINNAAGSRFAGGKIIMIEFTDVTQAVTLVNSAYLNLSGGVNYIPSASGGIVLYTRGDGTWRELSRF